MSNTTIQNTSSSSTVRREIEQVGYAERQPKLNPASIREVFNERFAQHVTEFRTVIEEEGTSCCGLRQSDTGRRHASVLEYFNVNRLQMRTDLIDACRDYEDLKDVEKYIEGRLIESASECLKSAEHRTQFSASFNSIFDFVPIALFVGSTPFLWYNPSLIPIYVTIIGVYVAFLCKPIQQNN